MSGRDQARAAVLLLKAERVLTPLAGVLGPEVRGLLDELAAFNDLSKPEPPPPEDPPSR